MPAPAWAGLRQDFVIVGIPEVRELGDYNTAGVWQRIHWRCVGQGRGELTTTYEGLAADVALSAKQVRRSVGILREKGWITVRSDGRGLVIAVDTGLEGTLGATQGNRSAPQGNRSASQGTLSSLYREEKREEERKVLQPALTGPSDDRRAVVVTSRPMAEKTAQWRDFWAAYPRKVGKRAAETAWVRACRRAHPADVVAAAKRLADDPNLPEPQFVPHPATWLNRDGWLDPPCPPQGRTARNRAVVDKIKSQTITTLAALEAR
jgi:hypothetical protein